MICTFPARCSYSHWQAAERSPNAATQNVCRKRAGDLVIRLERAVPACAARELTQSECRCEALQQRVGSGKSSKQEQAYLQVKPPLYLQLKSGMVW